MVVVGGRMDAFSARTGSAGAVLAGEARPATAGSRRPRGPTCGEQAGHVRARGARLPGAVAVCGVRRPPPEAHGPKGAGARRKAGEVGRRTSDNRRERRRVAGGGCGAGIGGSPYKLVQMSAPPAPPPWGCGAFWRVGGAGAGRWRGGWRGGFLRRIWGVSKSVDGLLTNSGLKSAIMRQNRPSPENGDIL